MNLTKCLIEWLKTFEINGSISCPEDLSDGIILANILSQIIPEFFTNEWLSKIDTDVENNWRVRGSNLRKVYEKLVDYYSEIETELEENLLPNVTKIALFYDNEELGLLLQLVLGCAINCHNKSYFVDIINSLDLEVQKGLMNAVKNVMREPLNDSVHDSSTVSSNPEMIRFTELETALENMRQECNELKEKYREKSIEYKSLAERAEKKSLEDKAIISNLKQNIDLMREELLTIEDTKDEIRSKCDLLEREVKQLRKLNSDLKYNQDKSDEKDMIRYLEEELSRLKEINQLQLIRLEEMKSQKISQKEEENEEEEEVEKCFNNVKNENSKLNKQLQELRLKLGEEIFLRDKAQHNYELITEKCNELIVERDKYQNELRLKTELKKVDNQLIPLSEELGFPIAFDYPINNGNFQTNGELSSKSVDNKKGLSLKNEIKNESNSDSIDKNYMTCNDINILKQLLQKKDIEIDGFKEEKLFRETEEKLMTISYHKMSSVLQRKSSEERLRKSVSLLSKQRVSQKTYNTIILGNKQSLIESQF